MWAANTQVDLALNNNPVGSGSISFNDLLDELDSAFMVNVEAGKGHWSMLADLTHLKTSDIDQRPLVTIDTDSKQTFVDAAAVYWPQGVGSAFGLLAGVRYADFDDRYRFSVAGQPVGERRSTRNYYDALLGIRYRFDLSDRWSLGTYGDFSFGDTEGTFVLRANLSVAVGQRRQNRIVFGYQYKQAEYEDGGLNSDYTYYGPFAGFSFRF